MLTKFELGSKKKMRIINKIKLFSNNNDKFKHITKVLKNNFIIVDYEFDLGIAIGEMDIDFNFSWLNRL